MSREGRIRRRAFKDQTQRTAPVFMGLECTWTGVSVKPDDNDDPVCPVCGRPVVKIADTARWYWGEVDKSGADTGGSELIPLFERWAWEQCFKDIDEASTAFREAFEGPTDAA